LLVRGAVAGVIALASMIPGWVSPVEAKWVPRTLGRAVAQSSPGTIHFDFAPTDVAASWVGPSDSEIEYRVTAADGSVSQWDHLHASPDMAKGRRQFSTIVGVDRPQSLEWRVAPGSASVRAVKFFYVNIEDGPLQRIEVPRVAEAAATTPNVVTRAEWGADESLKHISGDCKRDFAPLQQIFVHHTAAEPKGQDYDAAMRAIYWYHVKGRGWCDIGYNFVVAPNGRLFEGRWARDYAPFELHSSENLDGEAVVGAQVEGFNTGSIGVSLMGNYMNHSMTTAMRSSLVDFLAWEADRHNLDPTGSHVYRNPETGVHAWLPYIAGHRDAGKTSCPGDYVYRSLSALRKSVAQVIAAGKRATKLTLSGSTGTVPVGQPVTFKGRLVDEKGAALAGRQVKLYRRAGGQWSLVRKVTTGGAGGFSATFEPRRRFTLRAYYPGGVHLWSSVSHDFRVVVSHF
ncbi:MAG TPA: N-acetylmuramoyl-L-alanine amidase, partial [Actinomycetota bacterium]|nr:N-acetylmuramoyl-L-alanine amidase [Actinomycetota bacterium]